MPFALNEATRFISPTKTPEFLAAGVPVVSTPVPDVVRDWGSGGLVEIATRCGGLRRARGSSARAAAQRLDVGRQPAARAHVLGCDLGRDGRAHPCPPRPCAGGRPAGALHRMFDWLVVGAGFAGSVLAERLASQRGERVLVIDKRQHVAGNAFDEHDAGRRAHASLRAAYLPHQFRRGVRASLQLHRMAEIRAPRARARGRAARADPDQSRHGQPPLRARSRRRRIGGLVRGARRAGGRDPHLGRCRGLARRARALREVLPPLHAQAVGARSVRARPFGDRPRAGAHQSRRPLLHRRIPVHAARRATRRCSSAC